MNETPTAGQLSAARRAYTGTAADLEAILEEWDVHIVDEVDDNPERNPHVGFIPAKSTSLVDALLAWRNTAIRKVLDAQAVAPLDTAYPGTPGMTWADRDGDRWILCEDGQFRLRPEGHGVDPNEIAYMYGPMTLAGGA